MPFDWLRKSSDPPKAAADPPPAQEPPDAADTIIRSLQQDRDRWVATAAQSAREVLDLRVARDRAWADLEAAQRTIANLQGRVDRLEDAAARAPLADPFWPGDRLRSWSGLKEGE